ncbi:hypothetical protein C8A03DRAFT_38479 [Achaetomium macrosporum]|uniref:Uncharacterized protein n=1 Tax=Achaetomium macrosporum TaxID=79813 RepID=A0AAN7C2F2_9PEZI|nr:hypothetical protein C8A03DRAFT_38479 [Achaetomium macrosporum]
MGRKTAAFALPGFVCIAPSIYVQDSQMDVGNYGPDPGAHSSFSQSSLCPPLSPAAESSRRSRDTPPPDLIIITSWTGAASKHVAKYTASYNTLYPGVPILVITTVVSDLVIHSTKHKLKVLVPAVDYLLSQEPIYTPSASAAASASPSPAPFQDPFYSNPYISSSTPYPDQRTPPSTTSPPALPRNPHRQQEQKQKQRFTSILLHAFSEGGAHKAVLLAQTYLSATNHAAPLPLRALILDSAPGRADYRRATTAFTRSLPGNWQANPVGRVLAPPLAAGVVGLVWAGLRLRDRDGGDGGDKRAGSFIEETRRALNDKRLWDVGGIVRTYLFGEGDEVVWWRDVHDHGVESAVARSSSMGGEKGGGVGVGSLMVRFKRTEHCAHAKGEVNGAVYWAAVRATWEATVDGGMGLRLGLGRRLSLDSLYCGEDD